MSLIKVTDADLQFTRDGEAMGATGQLNTLWNDEGEELAANDWYGILFGAAAAWQHGPSSIPAFQAAYGPVFHGDLTGKLTSWIEVGMPSAAATPSMPAWMSG